MALPFFFVRGKEYKISYLYLMTDSIDVRLKSGMGPR